MKKMFKNSKGFTLLEILLVVAAIAILAGIVIIAINPGKQLADTRDAQRSADVNTILNAVYQYAIDSGSIPASITTTETEICATDAASCTAKVDLSVLTDNGTYIVAIPSDPSAATGEVDYTIMKNANGRVTVEAPNAENATISVTR